MPLHHQHTSRAPLSFLSMSSTKASTSRARSADSHVALTAKYQPLRKVAPAKLFTVRLVLYRARPPAGLPRLGLSTRHAPCCDGHNCMVERL